MVNKIIKRYKNTTTVISLKPKIRGALTKTPLNHLKGISCLLCK